MASVYPPPAPKPARPKPPTKRKKGSMDNDLRLMVPRKMPSPPKGPAPRRLARAERDAAIAKEMARGKLLPDRPRKKKKGMGY